jgi:hypothetical protein
MICGFLPTLGACVPITIENYITGSGTEAKHLITTSINNKKEDFMIYAYLPASEGIPKGDELWITIGGFRRSYDGDPNNVLRRDVPMLYSAQDAYVKDESGKITKADPEIYSSQKNGPITVIHQQVVNINVPETIYLRFDALRLPGSEWKLHLGKITINNESTEIPDFTILFRKKKVIWKPLMQ